MTSFRKTALRLVGVLLLATGAASAQNASPPAYGPLPIAPFAPPATPYVASPGQISDACYTGKGTCNLLRPQPIGDRCRCYIPGYGQRKGIVQP